ncbi:hypothetical protein KFE96_00185 [Kordiimonas sp. SCSIO 12603]|uniref:hypothetical protein n=1 Tax=Kordiimonas sp. SCSIO 12603 TaxID=2829596 RepID=UPI002102047F|nr:hypothetical protein [Kordiimonas sp. SCSIO 12603]UTW58760.1 hypothetical protein KFE96_00185 [Kordiimonas sp. SCSIO 12603]
MKIMVTVMALGALFFMRLMDVAAFDPDHKDLSLEHTVAHSTSSVHHHDYENDHDEDAHSNDQAHAIFHAAMSVYLEASEITLPFRQIPARRFELHLSESIAPFSSGPPVPPPLS